MSRNAWDSLILYAFGVAVGSGGTLLVLWLLH